MSESFGSLLFQFLETLESLVGQKSPCSEAYYHPYRALIWPLLRYWVRWPRQAADSGLLQGLSGLLGDLGSYKGLRHPGKHENLRILMLMAVLMTAMTVVMPTMMTWTVMRPRIVALLIAVSYRNELKCLAKDRPQKGP